MDSTNAAAELPRERTRPDGAIAAVLLASAVGALFFYKWGGAFRTLQKTTATGKLAVSPDALLNGGVWLSTLHYFARIWPALAYGVVIGAVVRSFVSPAAVARWLGRRDGRSNVAGALAGSPLMLCSCCVTPVFTGVYERGARLGSALSLMLASPGLNVAALTLTFLLLPAKLAILRIAAAALIVLAIAPAIGKRLENSVPVGKGPRSKIAEEPQPASAKELVVRFAKSLAYMLLVTVPIIVAGVVLSSLLLPHATRLSAHGGVVAVVAVALVGTLVALPTFFEIPLAFLLLQLGAPPGAAVALMIAGPIVNLPSLFVLAREANARVAVAVGVSVFAVASLAGLAGGV